MGKVVRLKRNPRPLRRTYSPSEPYQTFRRDLDDGSIAFEIYDERPESYRFVCAVSDDNGCNPYAKHDAEQIARALNFMVILGKEILPRVRERS